MLDKKTIFNTRRLMTSLILIAVIYLSLIPAAFDLSEQKSFTLKDAEYEEQLLYFRNNYDVLSHDGPGLTDSITTVHLRISQLNDAMLRKNIGNKLSLVPRWHKYPSDHYYSIQRISFLHILYPFL